MSDLCETNGKHCSRRHKGATGEVGAVQRSHRIDLCKEMRSPLRARCRYISSVGHGTFQVAPVPEGLQSMGALLVCAVMAHLEYNCRTWPDIVCLCVLVHCFLFAHLPTPPPPAFIPVCCMSDRSVCVNSLNDPILWQLG